MLRLDSVLLVLGLALATGFTGCANPENLEGKPCGVEKFGEFRCIDLSGPFDWDHWADAGTDGYSTSSPRRGYAYYRCDQTGVWRRTYHCDRYCPMPTPDIRAQLCIQ